MNYVTAIILAAGKGERLKSKKPKPLAELCGRPLVSFSLIAFQRHPLIKDIIVVVNPQSARGLLRAIKHFRIHKVTYTVTGGRRRQDSVQNGLQLVDAKSDIVIIHDSARPFIGEKLISSLIQEAKATGAAIAGVPAKATIKEVHRCEAKRSLPEGDAKRRAHSVKKTLNRENLWEIQTPQVFRKDLIIEAFKRFGRDDVTDDAMLLEKLGKRVSVVEGSYHNIKITTPEDLAIAEAIARRLLRVTKG